MVKTFFKSVVGFGEVSTEERGVGVLRGFGGHAGIIDDASGWNVRVATHGHGAGAHIHASMMYVVLKNTMNILLAQHVASVMLHSQRLQTERRLQRKAVDSEG